jgi:hypothetical protein
MQCACWCGWCGERLLVNKQKKQSVIENGGVGGCSCHARPIMKEILTKTVGVPGPM